MRIIISVGREIDDNGKGEIPYNIINGAKEKEILEKAFLLKYSGQKLNSGAICSYSLLKNASDFLKLPNAVVKQSSFYLLQDSLFDFITSRRIKGCDIFHGWPGQALISFKKAKNIDAVCFLQQSTVHPKKRKAILEEEYERFGIKNSKETSKHILSKYISEHEKADRIVVSSKWVYESFLEEGIGRGKLVLIPFGVDIDLFYAREKKDKVFRVLYIGPLSLESGIQYLLEAYRKLGLGNSELVLCGWREDNIVKVLEDYRGIYRYLGMVNRNSLPELISGSSVLVHPSISDGNALVTYQAMACSVPVITTKCSGSLVEDGMSGFVVPIRRSGKLSEKIEYFYKNTDECKAMGENARNFISGFTWKNYTDRLIEVYRKAYGKRN